MLPAHGEERHGRQGHGFAVGFLRAQPFRARHARSSNGLLDLGEQRIRHMDETGIDKAILALTAPGAQALLDVGEARGLAQRANDYLAEHVAARKDRYVGMTTVAPQDPAWSAPRDRARRTRARLQGRADQQPHPGRVSRPSEVRSHFPRARRHRPAALHPPVDAAGLDDRADARGGPRRRDLRLRRGDRAASAAPDHQRHFRSLSGPADHGRPHGRGVAVLGVSPRLHAPGERALQALSSA